MVRIVQPAYCRTIDVQRTRGPLVQQASSVVSIGRHIIVHYRCSDIMQNSCSSLHARLPGLSSPTSCAMCASPSTLHAFRGVNGYPATRVAAAVAISRGALLPQPDGHHSLYGVDDGQPVAPRRTVQMLHEQDSWVARLGRFHAKG